MSLVLNRIKNILDKTFAPDNRLIVVVWMILPVIAGLTKLNNNNFKMYRQVFWHVWNETSLFCQYPEEYFDVNHYGPFFALLIAPFAVVPMWVGIVFWNLAMTVCLYFAIRRLPMAERLKVFLLWFTAHELLTALFMVQFNVVIAAIIVGCWICVEKERDVLATFLILVGVFVKIYGIVGLAFFLFSKHKMRFVLSFVCWSVLFFVLPMLISSPDYVAGQYYEWYVCLTEKNQENMVNLANNVSLLGMVRRVGALFLGAEAFENYSDIWLILVGCIAFCLPYLRFGQWKNEAFRYAFLASVLLFVVLFSTGSESSGYIIAMTGVGIWYWTAPWKRGKWAVAMMVFVFVLTSLSPSDLFPRYVRANIVQPYALKSLPCVMVWVWLIWEMMTKEYGRESVESKES
ncbi:MAG: DUF2029 domain-containing protein [Bacteroidaceae bacterium]|nr:DUF2029 domain-containing protein [Bacteroidaceae bacterium]